jgi:hypothetical protein
VLPEMGFQKLSASNNAIRVPKKTLSSAVEAYSSPLEHYLQQKWRQFLKVI